MERSDSGLVASLFEPPRAKRWLPAFAAAAIGDPEAARALAPFIGPANQRIEGGRRARVPGEEHFARTWAVIKPGFMGTGSPVYAQHTRADHQRTQIPGRLISLPIQWIMVMLANTADDYGRPDLHMAIRTSGMRFAQDIAGDLSVIHMPLQTARSNMMKYFARVRIVPEQGHGFWRAMGHGPVRHDLWGSRGQVDAGTVQRALHRHLPEAFALQYMQFRPS